MINRFALSFLCIELDRNEMLEVTGLYILLAFADATSTPYGYLLVDLKQDTSEDLRLRTSILPDDVVQYVYMPKV